MKYNKFVAAGDSLCCQLFMSKFATAILVNLLFPGIGTLMAGKRTAGIIQTTISILCVIGMFVTLGFGVIIIGPIELLNLLWAVTTTVLVLDGKRSHAMKC